MSCFTSDDITRTNTLKAGVGLTFEFTQAWIKPWVNFEEGDEGTVQIGEHCGTFIVEAAVIKLTFSEKVIFTCGACVDFELSNACEACPTCITELTELNENTRFVVLDENDCPTFHVTWQQICEFIAKQACIKVCEQLCKMQTKEAVSAGMKLVGVKQDPCECFLLPVEALQCDVKPDPFCCGDDPCEPASNI